jgi:hypothetical protein
MLIMDYKDFEQTIFEQIENLKCEEQECQQKIKDIPVKICALNELINNMKQKQNLTIVERKESIKLNTSKLMDNKDILKVNLFLEFLEKCNDDTTFKTVREKMPKIEYYIYNKKKRLWSGYQQFRDDFDAWLNRKGYWTNAIPKPDNRPDDPQYPIMVFKKENEAI